MSSSRIIYNERSWGIEVISEINSYVSMMDRPIKRAGGEITIKSGTTSLFPDVLLFGDIALGDILQGWELKMPDTTITDNELINNAKTKAITLGLNSFLVWNVSMAVLYVSDEKGEFEPQKSWDELSHIVERKQVCERREEWISLLHKIISDLNDFFEEGRLFIKTIVESFKEDGIIEIILRNAENVAENLKVKAAKDADFDASVKLWWLASKQEYSRESNFWNVLSRIILVNWINKFLFSHILKAYYSAASLIDNISGDSTIVDGIKILNRISEKCDFLNILQPQIGEQYLSDRAWLELTQLNEFLIEIRLERTDQNLLQEILKTTILASKRKIAGQFTTPATLAELLVRLTVRDKNRNVFDPCCGTGTIARICYDIKKGYGLSHENALETVWASDKFSYPLLMATLALAEPKNIGQVINIFRKDITELMGDEIIEFCDPNNGEIVLKSLPEIVYIVSNLPFVKQEDLKELNPNIDKINERIKQLTRSRLSISGKSDLYAYLPFFFWSLLSDNGGLGIIISNSWLGTEWGRVFREILQVFYKIEFVIISGKGRWFKDTDVVTTIIILQKKYNISVNNENIGKISFITINKDISEIENAIDKISSHILLDTEDKEYLSVESYENVEITNLEELGVEWSALFANVHWIFNLRDTLIKSNSIFDIRRGERRGWDKMFYPDEGHGIENEYIRPVLKSSKEIGYLIAEPDAKAFCCSCSIEELERLGYNGAISWIRIFEHEVNRKGVPLPISLARANMFWYEMNDSTLADLVVSIDPDERLFIAKVRERSFVNQRLTRFILLNSDIDIDLCHALLNCIIGVFYIEALGFGRGLGVLDLNSTKVRKQLSMLNPMLIDNNQSAQIKEKFLPLLNRPVLPIIEELEMKDRQEFDDTVLGIYGILDFKEHIISSLMRLYSIRKAVDFDC